MSIVKTIARDTSTGYHPAMMQFNGTSRYYRDTSLTTSGNKVTVRARFKRASFTGGGSEYIFHADGASPTFHHRVAIWVDASDAAVSDRRSRVMCNVRNSAGTSVVFLASTASVCDGEAHSVEFAYDGNAGTAVFRVDGVNADNTGFSQRVAPIAGTLGAGAACSAGAGARSTIPDRFFGGSIGFLGYRDAYLTNGSSFFEADGSPKELDESTWTEWSGGSVTSPMGRPSYWNPHGDMANNLGSAGNMVAYDTAVSPTSGGYIPVATS